MNLDQLRETIMPVLAPYVSGVALFGSVARGEETEESDIDLLIRLSRPIDYFTLIDLEQELSTRLGRRVDLVTEGAMSPYIRPYIEQDKVILYESEAGLAVSSTYS